MLPWQRFCQGGLGQKFQFFAKKWPFFSFKTYLYRIFWLEFEIRAQNLPLFQISAQLTKDKGTRILTWNDTKNGFMTSYLPPSDDVSKIFMAFERFCPRVPSFEVWL